MFRERSAKILHTSKKKYKIEKQRKKSESRREMGGEDRDTIERKEGISISGNFVVYTMQQV